MSTYKLIKVVKATEEGKTTAKETQSIYDKDNLEQAISDMHNDFGVAVKQSSTLSVYCTLIHQETGEKVANLNWTVPPTPELVTADILIKERVYTHNNFTEDNISAYDSSQLAIGNYHTKLASQRNNANCYKAITLRLDSTGNIVDSSAWTRPIGQTQATT